MRTLTLDSGWRFRPEQREPPYPRIQIQPWPWMPASVPGNVHLDLAANQVIPNPLTRRHELGVQWIDTCSWHYEVEFEWTLLDGEYVSLEFDGLDTICDIFLNGELVGHHDNFYHPARFDVTEHLIHGTNHLRVVFHSAVEVGESRRHQWCIENGISANTVHFDERAFVRKPAYTFGWDWGPRLVGCGIIAPVRLIGRHNPRPVLNVEIRPDGDTFLVTASVENDPGESTFHFEAGDAQTNVQVEFTELNRRQWRVTGGLWWPRGYGSQIVHRVTARSSSGENLLEKIGLKDVTLVREPDQFGECFTLFVNGIEIWARGANWIPADMFPSSVTPEHVQSMLRAYANLNFNMIRVWGGGTYESEEFYDACDELGILVWQDFPFACLYYPDDETWQDSIRLEAEFHANRLKNRASLALWCGNNENLMMWQGKWGGEPQPSRFLGEQLFQETLPEVLAQVDPYHPYIASSPIGQADSVDGHAGETPNANMGGYGDSHYWNVWHGEGDWIHYENSTARFSSEFGFASAASLGCWENALSPGALSEFSHPEFLHHDKTGKPWDDFRQMVEIHYAGSESLEDWVYFSQLNQRDALRFGIEHYRRSEFCRGSLIWQANDCWPAQSWSVQDYSGSLKPAGFELKRLYADVLISVDYLVGRNAVKIWVCNDSLNTVDVELVVNAIDTLDRHVERFVSSAVSLRPQSRTIIEEFSVAGFDAARTCLLVCLDGDVCDERWIWLNEPKAMRWQKPVLTTPEVGSDPIHVAGIAPDLVFWDYENHANTPVLNNGLEGWMPQTIINGEVSLTWKAKPRRIAWRCLAGAGIIQ